MGRLPTRAEIERARERVADHRLPVHTSSIAFQVLVGLVPLVLLGFVLLDLLGLEDTWYTAVGPAVRARVSTPVYGAIDFSATEIFSSDPLGLLLLAGALLLWSLWRGVLAASAALNDIRGVREKRPWRRRAAITAGLALATGLCLVGAVLAMVVLPRVVRDGGAADVALSLLRFPVAAGLLGLCAALLLRYAGAERVDGAWATAGGATIVTGWIVLSLAFGFWVANVASYKTAFGNLAVFLVLAAYVLSASAVFLLGAELDELGRSAAAARGGKRRGRRARR